MELPSKHVHKLHLTQLMMSPGDEKKHLRGEVCRSRFNTIDQDSCKTLATTMSR